MFRTQTSKAIIRLALIWCTSMITILLLANNCNGQFIHIFEVQDENRAPKSDLFDPSQYKYVSPSQLQKQQEQNKLFQQQAQAQAQQHAKLQNSGQTSGNSHQSSEPTSSPQVPELRRSVANNNVVAPTTASNVGSYQDLRLNEIIHNAAGEDRIRTRVQNAYSSEMPLQQQPRPQPQPQPVRQNTENHHHVTAHHHHHHNSTGSGGEGTTIHGLLVNGTQVTYMQPISRILNNITNNHIPEQYESEIRKQIRMQQSENRYSRTQPLRVSAQNQRQYVVRVPAPFAVNLSSLQPAPTLLPQQQLPPNLQQQLSQQQSPQPPPQQQPQPQHTSALLANQYTPIHRFIVGPAGSLNPGLNQTSQPTNLRLSTLNSVLIAPSNHHRHSDNSGIPSSLLNSFLQRTQNQLHQQQQQQHQQQQQQAQAQPQQHPSAIQLQAHQLLAQPQPPYAANIPQQFVPSTSQPAPSSPQPTPPQQLQPTMIGSTGVPTGRSVSGVSSNSISLLQPPITNKESLTDEDIRLIEEHNRKVRIFLQQRQAELTAEQERIRRQKLAEEAAAQKAQQEAVARAAAEQERIRRLKAEQEAAARAAAEQERIRRIKAEQEAAARQAAEQERIRRIKAEQEAAARQAAEQERIRKIQEQQEAAARAAAEQERILRLRAEQERIRRLREEQEAQARAAAEQERIRRIKAEQEAVARLAAEQERIRRIKAEQDAADRERLQKLREEQEMAARAAAEQERLRRIHEEQERYQKFKAEQEVAMEQDRQRQLRAQQEAAIRLAEAERSSRLQRVQELAALRYQNPNLLSSNLSTNSLSYQPEPNLALDEATLVNRSHQPTTTLRSQLDNAGLVDAARIRAEKEALAEQERLLRFQASQQALAQQQAAEQNRLRRLREEEILQAEAERLAREAQERQILRARNEQSRLIQAARDAAHRDPATLSYTPYTEDLNKYQTTNYTTGSSSSPSSTQFGSLNNVRTPEPTGRSATPTSAQQQQQQLSPSPQHLRTPTISGDYARRSNLNQITSISAPLSSSSKNESSFKPAKISLQELPPDLDRDGIPGVAGRDYPTLIEIPKTSFSCARQPLNGYYADTETACQVVHMCQMGGVQDSFICPNGTIWNQEKFACQWWYEVNCATAPSFYALNNNLYKARFDGKSEPDSSSSSPSATSTSALLSSSSSPSSSRQILK